MYLNHSWFLELVLSVIQLDVSQSMVWRPQSSESLSMCVMNDHVPHLTNTHLDIRYKNLANHIHRVELQTEPALKTSYDLGQTRITGLREIDH